MASCPACKGEVPGGVRWRGICHTNVINASVGRLATPGKRLGAHFTDLAIPVVALLVILSASRLGVAAGGESAGGAIGLLIGFGLIVAYVVWALKLFARGTTPGKHVLGMKVVKENGQPAGFGTMLFREWIGKLISGLLFSLGYIWILLDKDRQGWQDKLASTYVVGG